MQTERVFGRRGEASPFDALLEAVERDAEAAAGLTSAYASLAPSQRRVLVEAIRMDCEAAGRSPASPLTLLLSVEHDPEIAILLAETLLDDAEAPLPGVPGVGWVWGSEENGGIALAPGGPASPHAGVFITFSRGALQSFRVTDLALDAVLDVPASAEPIEWALAVDRLAAGLWRARLRDGSLPAELAPLASVLGPRSAAAPLGSSDRQPSG